MFKYNVLVASDEWVIAISAIESFRLRRDPEDLVTDILKDDLVFTIRTVSGKEHEISIKEQIEVFGTSYFESKTQNEIYREILDKWITMAGENGKTSN